MRDGAQAIGARVNATVNGAHSVFPGTLNLPRSILRAAGLFGSAEAHRFDREMAGVGAALKQIVKHPEPALRAAGEAMSTAWNDPLLPYYAGGRVSMGLRTRLGPFAMLGDTLRKTATIWSTPCSILAFSAGHRRLVFWASRQKAVASWAYRPRSGDSMVSSRLTQFLESSRWAPHKLGALASLPIIAVMLLLWTHYEMIAVAWFCLYAILGGLWVFHTTPVRKMISNALFYGTLVPFLIMFAR